MCADVQINGNKGFYDKKNIDPSIKYGRNAVDNNHTYLLQPFLNDNNLVAPILDFSISENATDKNIQKLEQFANANDEYLASLPPLEYEYRYMPISNNGQVDKKALLGAAYEQMGAKELPVEEFEFRYLDKNMTAKPLDINKDGKIDIAEYSTNILATDLLSKDTTDTTKIDGTINTKGLNAILAYTQKANAAAATKLYSNLYNQYDLAKDISEFNPN